MSESDRKRAVEDATLVGVISSEAAQPVTPDEFAVMMAQAHYLVRDDDISNLLKDDKNPRMRRLIPALSHLLRTTNINNEKQLKEMKLNWKIAVRYELMIMASDDEERSMAELYAWLNFGYAAIEDTRKGWRGKLLTERIRAYRIEMAQKKRKLLGIF